MTTVGLQLSGGIRSRMSFFIAEESVVHWTKQQDKYSIFFYMFTTEGGILTFDKGLLKFHYFR